MKPAAMDPATARVVRAILCVPDEPLPQEFALLLLADRDHQAARVAAVIAAMVLMDERRKDDVGYAGGPGSRASFCEGAATRLGTALDLLRVALGLPSDWRDTCPRCGSGEGVCELSCDLEDGGEG